MTSRQITPNVKQDKVTTAEERPKCKTKLSSSAADRKTKFELEYF